MSIVIVMANSQYIAAMSDGKVVDKKDGKTMTYDKARKIFKINGFCGFGITGSGELLGALHEKFENLPQNTLNNICTDDLLLSIYDYIHINEYDVSDNLSRIIIYGLNKNKQVNIIQFTTNDKLYNIEPTMITSNTVTSFMLSPDGVENEMDILKSFSKRSYNCFEAMAKTINYISSLPTVHTVNNYIFFDEFFINLPNWSISYSDS